jgi:hypothetical protein
MAQEVTIKAFERNAQRANRNGLARSYNTMLDNYKEYVPYPPLSSTSKLMFEVTVDKDYTDQLIELIKNEGFPFFGSVNYFYTEEFINQYNKAPNRFNVDPKMIEALSKDLVNLKKEAMENASKEAPNDDRVFYFMPYAEGISTLYEFIKAKKDLFLKFAKDNDITIMIKIIGFNSQISGFLGFNFFDADKKDEEVVIDYASRITVGVNFKDRTAVYVAALYLNGIGETEEELYDSEVNTHIVTEKAVNA